MNKCVLIIDDDQNFGVLLRGVFQQAGYTVHLAVSADLALDLLQKETIHLIVTDQRLPGGMSGTDLIRKLRRMDLDIPVIMVSGFLTDESIREIIRDGVKGVFIKPLNIFSLLKKASEILEKSAVSANNRVNETGSSPPGVRSGSIGHIEGLSKAGQKFVQQAREAASFKRNLLLIGPTGTLFEDIGRDIVTLSGVGERCFSFQPSQVTSQNIENLFTGEDADRPTALIFLDAQHYSAQEVDNLVKLADERGGSASLLRMIFCLSKSVEDLYDTGEIDEEFYLFLGTNELRVPSLREMPEDLLAIARREIQAETDCPFDVKLRTLLLDYGWPGNLLEMRTIIVRAINLANPLPPNVKHFEVVLQQDQPGRATQEDSRSSLERFLENEKHRYLDARRILGEL